jgi:hypothetical protein
MKHLKIFVEGILDHSLIEGIINNLVKIPSDVEVKIVELGGYTKLFSEANIETIKGEAFLGVNHIAFIDCDTNFQERKRYIDEKIQKNNIHLDYYLIPNNSSSGTVESVILNIINSTERDLLKCFENYIECLRKCNNIISLPGDKEKVFAFLSAKTSLKKNKIDLKNSIIWNINHPLLTQLSEFITNVIKKL